MVNKTLENIKSKSFEEFREQNSSGEKDDVFDGPDESIGGASLELGYSTIFGELSAKGGIHLAVTGGVHSTFGQISELNPDLSLLVDVNDSAIDYLRFRGILLDAQEDGAAYGNALVSLVTPYSELTPEKVMSFCNGKLPNQLLENIMAILEHEKRFIEKAIEYEREACAESGRTPAKDLEILPVLQRDYSNGGWTSDERYDIVKKAWQEGRIKGVRRDITDGGFSLAFEISQSSGVPITLIYLSNIDDYLTPQKRIRLMQSIREGIDERLIDPQCKIIDWTVGGTRIHEPANYVK